MLSEESQTQNATFSWFYLYEIPRAKKSLESDSVIARGRGKGEWGMTANG